MALEIHSCFRPYSLQPCVKQKLTNTGGRPLLIWETWTLLIPAHNLQGKGKDSGNHGHPVSHHKGTENGQDTQLDGQKLARQDALCPGEGHTGSSVV